MKILSLHMTIDFLLYLLMLFWKCNGLKNNVSKNIWAAARQNQQNDLCAQRRLISALASAQSDQSSLSAGRNIGPLTTYWAHSEDWSDWADAQADLRWLIRMRLPPSRACRSNLAFLGSRAWRNNLTAAKPSDDQTRVWCQNLRALLFGARLKSS